MNGQNNHTAKGLPESWQWTKLSDLAQINPKLPVEVKDESLEVSFLPMKLVEEEKNQIHLTENKSYKDVKKGFTPMIDGDVIFAKITPCMENGKIAVVHSLTNGIGFGSTEFHVLRCNGNLINKFLFYYIVQKQFRHEAESNMTGAVGQRRVPKRFLEESLIPLPTVEEQEKIVFRIEELFSELNKSIEDLKTAQQQLKVYRKSVLKWAFESIEKTIRKSVEEICTHIVDCLHSTAKFEESGKFCVDTTCIAEGKILFNKIRYVNDITFQQRVSRLKPQEGDILFAREGTVGTSVIVPKDIELCLGQRMMMFRLNQEVLPKYFLYYLQSPVFKNQYRPLIGGTTSPHLNIRDIKKLDVIVCSKDEQLNIVQEIESRLSVADKVEETIVNSLEQAEALWQSILKKAFEGKLIQ